MKSLILLFVFFCANIFVCNSQVIDVDESDSSYLRIKNNEVYQDLMKLPFEDAIVKYPNPFRTDEFNAMSDLPYGRSVIRNVVPYKKKDRIPTYIKEVCWRLDSLTNMTVWYKKDSVLWKPLLNQAWVKGTAF